MHNRGNQRDDQNGRKQHWTLDYHIPLVALVGLLIQTGGIVAWAAGVQGDTKDAIRRVAAVETAVPNLITDVHVVSERLARVETTTTDEKNTLQRIEDMLTESRSNKHHGG